MQNIAKRVPHPTLSPEIDQRLRQVVFTPDLPHNPNVACNNTSVPGPVCHEGLFQRTSTQQTKHKAPNGTTSMFALSAVDQDGLAEQNRDKRHLHGMLKPLPPRASLMLPTPVEKQPLPYAQSTPRIVPGQIKHHPPRPIRGSHENHWETQSLNPCVPYVGFDPWHSGQGEKVGDAILDQMSRRSR